MENVILSCPFTLSSSTPRVLWEVTSKCNLKCRHCLYFNNQMKPSPDLTFEQLIDILDSIAKDGQIKAIWLSGGEPLLRDDLVRFAQEISKRGITPSISTNGTLLTDRLACQLYDAGVRYVHLSIDGTTADVHDRIRNTSGSFDAVLRGASYLRHNNIRIGASYMVTWDSIAQVSDMVSLGIEKGLEVISFYLVAPIGRGALAQDSEEYRLMRLLEESLTPHMNLIKPKIEVFRTVSTNQSTNSLVGLMECKGQCFYTITNDGYLASCPWFAKKKTMVLPVSLINNSFADGRHIINERMNEYLCNREKNIASKCSECIHNKNCGRGCPAVCFEDGIDPLCRYLR